MVRQCGYCPFSAETKEQVEAHYDEYHRLWCPFCPYSHRSREVFWEHVESMHHLQAKDQKLEKMQMRRTRRPQSGDRAESIGPAPEVSVDFPDVLVEACAEEVTPDTAVREALPEEQEAPETETVVPVKKKAKKALPEEHKEPEAVVGKVAKKKAKKLKNLVKGTDPTVKKKKKKGDLKQKKRKMEQDQDPLSDKVKQVCAGIAGDSAEHTPAGSEEACVLPPVSMPWMLSSPDTPLRHIHIERKVTRPNGEIEEIVERHWFLRDGQQPPCCIKP